MLLKSKYRTEDAIVPGKRLSSLSSWHYAFIHVHCYHSRFASFTFWRSDQSGWSSFSRRNGSGSSSVTAKSDFPRWEARNVKLEGSLMHRLYVGKGKSPGYERSMKASGFDLPYIVNLQGVVAVNFSHWLRVLEWLFQCQTHKTRWFAYITFQYWWCQVVERNAKERRRETPFVFFFRFEELFENTSDSRDNDELAGDVR